MPDNMLFSENNIEIHYYLSDNLHSVDAFIHNRAQIEFLLLAKEVAQILELELEIEVFPLKEGGIQEFFKFKLKRIGAEIALGCVVSIISNFITTPINQLTGEWIKKLLTDSEMSELQKEKIKAEIENINADTALKLQNIESNPKLAIHKSRFYKELQKSSKIEKFSIQSFDVDGSVLMPEQFVHRVDFPYYIVDSSSLPDITIEHASIEIVSPVLRSGLKSENIKWKGIYAENVINFSMYSWEFKHKIRTGEINFKTGFTIDCRLVIKRKLDENGLEKITAYIVKTVNSYHVDDGIITETQEGIKQKKREQNHAACPLQPSLFDDNAF